MSDKFNYEDYDYEEEDAVRKADDVKTGSLVGVDDSSIEKYIESLKINDPLEYSILRKSRDDYLREKKYDEEIARLQYEARKRYEAEKEFKLNELKKVKDEKEGKVKNTITALTRISRYEPKANLIIKKINNFIEFNFDYVILTQDEYKAFFNCFDDLYLNRVKKSLEPKIPKDEDEYIRNIFICDEQ